MFFCDGARERRDGAQVNLKAHALQLISTLAALIVEPPRADAASEAPIATRLHGVRAHDVRCRVYGRRRQAAAPKACARGVA